MPEFKKYIELSEQEEKKCPVCGAPLSQDLTCKACRTPRHNDNELDVDTWYWSVILR